MLWNIVKRYIKPVWLLLLGVLVFQLLQAVAALLLPTLNAQIIDYGVVPGDIGYIWRRGGIMLGVTLVQVLCSIATVYFASKLSMGVGRDLGDDIFRKVVSYSQQEVGHFGPSSLIVRNTNDVQQVQTLVQTR